MGRELAKISERMPVDMPYCLFLIDRGADLEQRGEWGMTPLIRSAYQGNEEMVSALLQAGADIHARDQNGMTALTWAVRKKMDNVTALLLSAGADPYNADDAGETPMSFAGRRGLENTVLAMIDSIACHGVNRVQESAPVPLLKKRAFPSRGPAP